MRGSLANRFARASRATTGPRRACASSSRRGECSGGGLDSPLRALPFPKFRIGRARVRSCILTGVWSIVGSVASPASSSDRVSRPPLPRGWACRVHGRKTERAQMRLEEARFAMSFTSFDLHPDLLRGVEQMGFAVPTPIQKDAIPPALEGKDVLACAMTGSGKTAAFLLPILQRLIDKPRGVTRALVVTPTRELAAQIDEHRRDLARFTRLSGAAIFGGVGMGPQETAFRRGVDIVVATPGRLLDHLRFPYTRLDKLEVLVLDEVDRMLDMGFLPDVRRVLARVPARRQTLFFSATLPPPIAALAREMLPDPIAINVERPSAPATGITHTAYPVPAELKSMLFLKLLEQPGVKSVLAFTRTKHRANRLADFLARRGVALD